MKQRLTLLNAALLLAVLGCAWVLRNNWLEARQRERDAIARRARTGMVAPYEAPAPPKPSQPASFSEVALKTLFSKDRNPTVIEEPPPPPPPPPPVPPFPKAYGIMDIGQGPMIFIGQGGGKQRLHRVGDDTGPWKILAIKGERVTLEWTDQKKVFEKTLAELKDRSGEPAGGGGNTGGAAANNQGLAASEIVTIPTVKAAEPVANPDRPGIQAGASRLCNPGDTSPPGAVVDGFRKVVAKTPFGDVCRWDPVN